MASPKLSELLDQLQDLVSEFKMEEDEMSPDSDEELGLDDMDLEDDLDDDLMSEDVDGDMPGDEFDKLFEEDMEMDDEEMTDNPHPKKSKPKASY